MMAVWRPTTGSGMCRNRADTANQSASAPTSEASVTALMQASHSGTCCQCAAATDEATKPSAMSSSNASGRRLADFSV